MDFGSLFRLDGFFCVPGTSLAGEENERVCALNVRYSALGRTSEVLAANLFCALLWRRGRV